jgi:tRNA-Thr(GGU) m(6)t(6)A37 methyltransferase TsaA
MDLVPNQLKLRPIAFAKSVYRDKFGVPRQSGLVPEAMAFLRFLPEVQPEISLQGLEQFSHLWVIWLFHKNSNDRFHAKVHPPRLNGKSMGLFATRSPHRPNPIGLSLVKLVKLESTGVWVSGVDLLSGTPILDIKPYLVEIEARPEASSGWTDQFNEDPAWQVRWAEQALQQLNKFWNSETSTLSLPRESERLTSMKEEFVSIVNKSLALDPRPVVYRKLAKKDGTQGMANRVHASRMAPFDVHFSFDDDQRTITVEKLIPLDLVKPID